MQSVKLYMRQVGNRNAEAGIISAADFEEEVEYKFTSKGYEMKGSHYLGDIRDSGGGSIGYKILVIFTKDEAPAEKKKTLKDT